MRGGYPGWSCFAATRHCSSPTRILQERALVAVATSPVRWMVFAAEPVTSVDVTACDRVAELDKTLHAQGIELCFGI